MKIYRVTALLLAAVMILPGCGRRRTEEEEDNYLYTDEGIAYLEDEADLEDNEYYVLHDGRYEKLYFGNATYDTSGGGSGRDRVLWFDEEDFGRIPTLYRGDKLVYHKTDDLEESFELERFYDDGYTIGIAGLEEMDSGRYAFEALEGNSLINPASDAARVRELNAEVAIIDTIGGSPLRAGNISECGTIIGLTEGKYYSTDIYVGTRLSNYVLCADSRAMHSVSREVLHDYTFLRSTILQVNLPTTYNTGYYAIAGHGLFRYVDGTSYSDMTDFNIENERTQSENTESGRQDIYSEENAVESIPFTLKKDSRVKVHIEYFDTSEAQGYMAAPSVKVIGSNSVQTITGGDGLFEATLDLKAGRYTIEISGLNGRKYSYNVTRALEEGEQAEESGEKASPSDGEPEG